MFQSFIPKLVAGLGVVAAFFGIQTAQTNDYPIISTQAGVVVDLSVEQDPVESRLLGIDSYPFISSILPASDNLGAAPQFVGGKVYTLAGSGISSTDTTITLVSFTLPVSNQAITSSDLGSPYYITLEPSSASKKEITSCTGVTQNSNGTASLTGCTRGLSPVAPYTASTTLRQTHSGGTRVVLSNPPQLYQSIISYIDNATTSGAVDSSATVKGLLEVASGVEAASTTPIGGGNTTAPLALTTGISTSTCPSTGSYVVVTVNGKISSTCITTVASTTVSSDGYRLSPFVGDGSDGDVTIGAGTTTLSRNMYYNNLTVTGVLDTAGYIVNVKGVLNGAGTITATSSNGSNGSGTTGGAGGSSIGGIFKTAPGGTGGSSSACNVSVTAAAGTSVTSAIGAAGVTGGSGGANGGGSGSVAGGAGGSVASTTYKLGISRQLTMLGIDVQTTGSTTIIRSSGGGGGGGAARSGGAGPCGAGGGGGASGNIVLINVNNWAGSFTIRAVGGNGGNGSNATDAGGGGGAGGSGGVSIVNYYSKSWTGSYVLTGGTGGTGGTGTSAGSAGSTGTTGYSFEIPIGNMY